MSAFRTHEEVSLEGRRPKNPHFKKKTNETSCSALRVPAVWVLLLPSVPALLWPLLWVFWFFLSAPGFGSGPGLPCFLCPGCFVGDDPTTFRFYGPRRGGFFSDELWTGIPCGGRGVTASSVTEAFGTICTMWQRMLTQLWVTSCAPQRFLRVKAKGVC